MKRILSTVLLSSVILTGFPGVVLAEEINKPDMYKVSDTISYDVSAAISTTWPDHVNEDIVITNITIMRTSQANSFYAKDFPKALELDWECTLGTGGSGAAINASVTRNGDNYTVKYKYCLYDTYDWEINGSFVIGLPKDAQMHEMLHMTGLAREYHVYGEFTNTFTVPSSLIDELKLPLEVIQ